MSKIYRVTDRVKVKIDDITISVSPLSKEQKRQLMSLMMKAQTGDLSSAQQSLEEAIKFSVKSISGVTDGNDEPYALEFQDGALSEACVNDLLNMEIGSKIQAVCIALLNNVPKTFVDQNGKAIEGVKIIPKGSVEEGKS